MPNVSSWLASAQALLKNFFLLVHFIAKRYYESMIEIIFRTFLLVLTGMVTYMIISDSKFGETDTVFIFF